MKKPLAYFSRLESALWISSVAFITVSFFLFDRTSYSTLTASLIGVTSLILSAKGNPLGQVLMIIFSTFYGIISYSFGYYGEMLTYLCMTMPMSVFALISWLRNPYKGNKSEVRVGSIGKKEWAFALTLTLGVTVMFYYILDYFCTANIIPGTLSVSTSFLAVYLTFRRSPYFALAYAANDVVLIVLWILASFFDTGYISVVICFVAFLFNDLYCFINWQKMKKRQK